MKARLFLSTTAAVAAALSLTLSAGAANRPGDAFRLGDYTVNPGGIKTWSDYTVKPGTIKPWSKPDGVKGWSRLGNVKGWSLIHPDAT